MEYLIISLVLLGLALVALVILVFIKMKNTMNGEVKEINYQAFFTLGISFVGLGVAFTAAINPGFIGFIGLGIVYIIIGWKNKEKKPPNNRTKLAISLDIRCLGSNFCRYLLFDS